MRSLMSRIDKFCYKHPNFGINNLMLIIVIGNVALWLVSAMDTTGYLLRLLTFSPREILHGQIWRLVTFVFVPNGGNVFGLLITLYFYYFIGSSLESEWGKGRFTIYYLMGLLLTVIYGFINYFVTGLSLSVSAGYINMSMFFAFATLFPDNIVLLFFILPIKMKWLAIIDVGYFVYAILSMLGRGYGMMSFLPLMAILNYFIFCGGWLLDYVRPSRVKQKARTVNYKREVKRMNREMENKPYNRKCAVCGKTDAEYPNMEFRYCSRCAGYHCFCEEHIGNHVHFKE